MKMFTGLLVMGIVGILGLLLVNHYSESVPKNDDLIAPREYQPIAAPVESKSGLTPLTVPSVDVNLQVR